MSAGRQPIIPHAAVQPLHHMPLFPPPAAPSGHSGSDRAAVRTSAWQREMQELVQDLLAMHLKQVRGKMKPTSRGFRSAPHPPDATSGAQAGPGRNIAIKYQ